MSRERQFGFSSLVVPRAALDFDESKFSGLAVIGTGQPGLGIRHRVSGPDKHFNSLFRFQRL